jgi:adenine-specific DNA-methyltransferase
LWLSLVRDRLEILRRLLAREGSIWISIDDREMPYLRVLLDEVFGRANFIATVIWQKKYGAKSTQSISLNLMTTWCVTQRRRIPSH